MLRQDKFKGFVENVNRTIILFCLALLKKWLTLYDSTCQYEKDNVMTCLITRKGRSEVGTALIHLWY